MVKGILKKGGKGKGTKNSKCVQVSGIFHF